MAYFSSKRDTFNLVAALLAVSLSYSCTSRRAEEQHPLGKVGMSLKNSALETKPLVAQNIEVKCATIAKRVLGKNLHIDGHIQAETEKETEISPRFAGRVVEVNVKLGDNVRAGQILFRIDSSEISNLQAELIEARSKLHIAEAHEERELQIYHENLQRPKALTEARTRYAQSKVHLQLTESEYKRIEGLHQEKIAAEKDFVAAQAALAKAKLEEKEALTDMQREQSLYDNRSLLRRDLQLAEAESVREVQHVNTLKQRLVLMGLSAKQVDEIMETSKMVSILPIKTRVAGTVTFIDTSVGEMIAHDKHILTITDLSQVAVIADLPEVDLADIKVGRPVRVKVPSYPDKTFSARVEHVSDSVNPVTHTVAVRAALDNSARKFKINMSADIFLDAPPRAVLACPKDALRSYEKGKIVFVRDGNEFREREVELGADDENYYEVVSGLKEGEEVVTQGSVLLKSELMHD